MKNNLPLKSTPFRLLFCFASQRNCRSSWWSKWSWGKSWRGNSSIWKVGAKWVVVSFCGSKKNLRKMYYFASCCLDFWSPSTCSLQMLEGEWSGFVLWLQKRVLEFYLRRVGEFASDVAFGISSDNFQDQMKRELSYREEMVQQLQIVRGWCLFLTLCLRGFWLLNRSGR